jgi:Protein of unknown function (DUF4019)
MRIMLVVLLIGLSIGIGFSQSRAESVAEKAAISAAQSWLVLADAGKYGTSWKEASSYFRGAVTERSWEGAMEGFRKPLGKLVSRKITKAEESSSLPGAPDGRYVVMSFETSFENKKSAVETVTFMLDKDRKWRAAGYFIG